MLENTCTLEIRGADPTRAVQPLTCGRIRFSAANRNRLREALQILE